MANDDGPNPSPTAAVGMKTPATKVVEEAAANCPEGAVRNDSQKERVIAVSGRGHAARREGIQVKHRRAKTESPARQVKAKGSSNQTDPNLVADAARLVTRSASGKR
jgi:hypothetical protein